MIDLATAVAKATEAVAVAATKSPELQAGSAAGQSARRLVWALLAMDDRPAVVQHLAAMAAKHSTRLRSLGFDPAAIVRSAADALSGVGHEDVARLRAWADAQ